MRPLIALVCLMASLSAHAQLVFETDFSVAQAKAKAQGKLILADFCRPACTECLQTIKVWNSPTLAATITNNFILFSSDIDHSPVWKAYGKGLAGASLPLVVAIDPNTPTGTFKARWTGFRAAPIWRIVFTQFLSTLSAPVITGTNLLFSTWGDSHYKLHQISQGEF